MKQQEGYPVQDKIIQVYAKQCNVLKQTNDPLDTAVKPQSHRIVRFLDRTIGRDWAQVRPIGNVYYDLQQPTRGRAITNDWRISMARAIVGNRATSGSDQRPTDVRSVIAPDDRSYDQSWRQIGRSIVTAGERWYDQSLHPATDRTSNRGILHVTDRTSTSTL